MIEPLERARAELRRRQGAGARYDAPNAPARELDWARRGTAYFARLLNDLADTDFDAPARTPGLTRRHIIAHIGYQARVLSGFVAQVREGKLGQAPEPLEVRNSCIEQGRTLPAHALRHLFAHSAVHLDVEWRDLSSAGWDVSVTDASGKAIAMREIPLIRARSLWLGALDLKAGGRRADMPGELAAAVQ